MLTSDDDEYYQALFWKQLYDAREGKPWSELQHTAERTTTVVRDLVQSLVANNDRISGEELQTLYHLCQNTDDGKSIDERRERVRNLDLPADDIDRITEQIEQPMGSVGSAMEDPNLKVGDPEENNTGGAAQLRDCFERLISNVDPVDESELLDAVADLVTIDFRRVQSGRMSPILHYLAPEVFPIINSRSREGMARCFAADISSDLSDYLDERETYLAVRDKFEFKSHFRNLDWFFNWVNRDDNPWTAVARQNETRQYWQAQPGTRKHGHPAALWPRWQNENIISMGVDYGPVSSFDSPDDLGTIGRVLVDRMSPGDLVVGKAGHWNLLGIGVVTPGGYEYRTTDEGGIGFSNQGESGTHRDIRHVEWLFTLPEDDWLDIEGWDMSKQFNNKAIISYNCFHELRYKLFEHLGDDVLDDLEDIERTSVKYLLESNPEPRDVPEQPEPEPEPAPEPEDKSYYWATADPSIWSVEDITDGGTVFYSAYNDKGNKKRLFDAFETASPGDRVLFYESSPVKAIVAEGVVVEGLHDEHSEVADHTSEADTKNNDSDLDTQGVRIEFDHKINNITWDELTAVPDLEDSTPIANRAQGSLFQLTKSEYETILAIEDTGRTDVPQEALDSFKQKLTSPQLDITIPGTLYFDDEARLRREIEASLHSGKHIILTGPPGTGKTKLAKAICETATTHDQVDGHRFTTATSEWTAFDTIGGYVPSTSGGGQELHFEPRLFLKCFRQDSVINQWLIIDEINRSDIDKAFGQLFSVLSGDSTELPYERERTVELISVSEQASEDDLTDIIANPDAFPVTPSWRLIATMNTYDKTSLYEMSYAFMRRFNFIHVGVPPLTTDDGVVRTSLLDPTNTDNYASVWLDENPDLRPVLESSYDVIAVLWQQINEHRVIGPSIVYDILRYLHSYDDATDDYRDALTSAVISLVYPQLEGMRPDQQKQLIRSLTEAGTATQDGHVDLNLDGEVLRAKASDFFGIRFDDDS